MTAINFDGDFSLLPFAASVRYGAVPAHVNSNAFQSAACLLSNDLALYPEAHWQLEAYRERLLNPRRSLDEAARDIARRVAARLFEMRGDDRLGEKERWAREKEARETEYEWAEINRLEAMYGEPGLA